MIDWISISSQNEKFVGNNIIIQEEIKEFLNFHILRRK